MGSKIAEAAAQLTRADVAGRRKTMTGATLLPEMSPRLTSPALAISEQARVRRQWLDVDGFITDRLLITYRAPAATLRGLVPAAFELDEWCGHGFVSVCALEVHEMGLCGAPSVLRFENRELLYRLGVRYRGQATFITLRSDTGSKALALLGSAFSHYGLRHAAVQLTRGERSFEMTCSDNEGRGTARAVARLEPTEREPASVFADSSHAAEQLIGMSFSVGARGGRVLMQPIEHEPWQPRFVPLAQANFAYLRALEQRHGFRLEYDNTLHVQNVRQIWRAARWQK
jgi:hypothetical protein